MSKGQAFWLILTVLVLVIAVAVLVKGDEEYFQYLPVIHANHVPTSQDGPE